MHFKTKFGPKFLIMLAGAWTFILYSGYGMCDGIVVKLELVGVDCISVSVILFYFKVSTNSTPIHIYLYLI